MRALLTLFSTLVVCTLLTLDQPARARALLDGGMNAATDFWFTKEIWISGTKLVDRHEIEALLPQKESVLSWMLHREQLSALLRGHPLVRDARVEGCDEQWWGCFRIQVTERDAFFIAVIGRRGWVIGEDGGVMTPLPGTWPSKNELGVSAALARPVVAKGQKSALSSSETSTSAVNSKNSSHLAGKDLTVVEGLGDEHESPDTLRIRFSQAVRVIQLLDSALNRGVSELRFEPGREILARFADTSWSARFDIGGDEQWEDRLGDQAARLVALIEKYPERLIDATQVDLAFERIAVVRYPEGENHASSPVQLR